jgi:zinc protease
MLTFVRGIATAGRSVARFNVAIAVVLIAPFLFVSISRPAAAMNIQQIQSPGGIKAWLVEEHSVPLISLRYAFNGGNSQDPEGKAGLANFITAMMDEGAGDIKSEDYQERMEDLAMRMSYDDSKDSLYGSFETLTANRDTAVALLKLSVQSPRFDNEAIERIRQQLIANLIYADKDPDKVAVREWYAQAFAGHPYARPSSGTPKSVAAITRDDLLDYHKRVFARDNLNVVAVGDITAEDLGKLIDDVFGALPAKADLYPVPVTEPVQGGHQQVIDMGVPQSVAVFGLGAMRRMDPDFMTAFVVNHILGGGGFSAKLMEEVREKRGLAYSVYTYIQPDKYTSILLGSVATKNASMAQSLDIIRDEMKKMAENGPTQQDLDAAKSYLTGSYALRFDTNSKIAAQLLGLMQEGFGPDYVENRNKMINAVTLADAKRVAARLFKPENLIVTIVGRPAGVKSVTPASLQQPALAVPGRG